MELSYRKKLITSGRILTFQLFLLFPALAIPLDLQEPTVTTPDHIVYLVHTGNETKALRAYQLYKNSLGRHDFELIERIGLTILDQGYRSKDPETQLLTIFGAGISTNEKAIYILEGGVGSGIPQLEVIALNFLAKFHNDRADQALHRAMSSNNALVRLEAALQLALKKDPKAIAHLDALMAKLIEETWVVFPKIYALIDNPDAKLMLKKLMAHPNEKIRIATIISVAESGHDDFLPALRRRATHHGPAEQEACATALGVLRDEVSASLLMELCKNPHTNVQLAALQALYSLGREDVIDRLIDLAKRENLFAIYLLGKMPGSEDFLASLLRSNNFNVQINAAHALLELGDGRCLVPIAAILLDDPRDLAVLPSNSPGKSLKALRVVPSAKQNFDENPLAEEAALSLKEDILIKCVDLPEQHFLRLAETIFNQEQNDLVPTLVSLMENHPTPQVIQMLKKHQQKVGAPLIRNYCNLALYRMKQPGPYADNLMEWVKTQREEDLIRFRPLLPWDSTDKDPSSYQLTAQEKSRLLLEAFEAFVSTQDDKGIDMLVSIIQSGNPKNKYALVGLLMRAIQ